MSTPTNTFIHIHTINLDDTHKYTFSLKLHINHEDMKDDALYTESNWIDLIC